MAPIFHLQPTETSPQTEVPVIPSIPGPLVPDVIIPAVPNPVPESTIVITFDELKSLLDQASGGLLTQPWATLLASFAVLGSGFLVYRNGNKTRGQEQEQFEASHDLEVTRGLRDRFTTIASQLADPAAAVRTAGIYAMEALADDWLKRPVPAVSEAQACINVLCSYLRAPYVPPLGQSTNQSSTVVRVNLTDRVVEEKFEYRQDDREVRQSIIRVIATHLQPIVKGDKSLPCSWSELDFDFTGAYLVDCDFSGAVFNRSVTFERSEFHGVEARFRNTQFCESANFEGARFLSRRTAFDNASFCGDRSHFAQAVFRSIDVRFDGATFSGSITDFRDCQFEGEETSFEGTRFKSANTLFLDANFSSRRTWFVDAEFTCAESVRFIRSSFAGEAIDFDRATFNSKDANFSKATFAGGVTSFDGAEFVGSQTKFSTATFTCDQTSFDKATLGVKATVRFNGTHFQSPSGTTFNGARFIGGRVSFVSAHFDNRTSFERPEVFANVEFDWTTDRGPQPSTVVPAIWPPERMT